MTSVQQCRTFQGTDMDSDHSLVIANFRLKLKRKSKPKFQKQRDLRRLNEENIGTAYRELLKKKISKTGDSKDLNDRVEELVRAMTEACNEVVPEEEKIKKKWITRETIKLVEEKRSLKTQKDVSELAKKCTSRNVMK